MRRPSSDQIQKLLDLKAHKAQLEAEARRLEPEIDSISDSLEAYLDKLGKESARISGFQVAREPGKASVKWKEELSRIAGPAVVAELIATAPRGSRLVVLPGSK